MEQGFELEPAEFAAFVKQQPMGAPHMSAHVRTFPAVARTVYHENTRGGGRCLSAGGSPLQHVHETRKTNKGLRLVSHE
jgi:hypothetical protein